MIALQLIVSVLGDNDAVSDIGGSGNVAVFEIGLIVGWLKRNSMPVDKFGNAGFIVNIISGWPGRKLLASSSIVHSCQIVDYCCRFYGAFSLPFLCALRYLQEIRVYCLFMMMLRRVRIDLFQCFFVCVFVIHLELFLKKLVVFCMGRE